MASALGLEMKLKNLRSVAVRAGTLAASVALCAPVQGQTTVVSSPVGVLSAPAPRGATGLAFPLIAGDVFAGVADANTGSSVVFPDAAGEIGARLASGTPYYLEVLDGDWEGERLDLDVEATIAAAGPTVELRLGAGSHSTLPALGENALAGARCAIRPHLTLAALQQQFTPGLVGRDVFLLADGVWVFEAGALSFYYLRADGATWRAAGGTTTDQRQKVIPPDISVLLDVKSGAQSWAHPGKVRLNAFRKNLAPGFQSFATGYPLDLSPAQVGAFVDATAPPATRWTGNNLFARADQFELLFGEPQPLQLYFLRGDGTTWRSLTSSTNVANVSILPASGMILLRRVRPNPDYAIPRPF